MGRAPVVSVTETTCVLCAAGRPAAFGAWREALAAHQGRPLPGQGGLVAARFDSVAAAVAAAVELQRQHLDGDGPPGARLGIAVGDAQVGEHVVAGTPVAEAAALALRAEPGQVLVSAAVPLLVGGSPAVRFASAGELGGAWRPRPQPVWELVPAPAGRLVVPAVTFPPLLRAEAEWPWLPPEAAVASLEGAWAAAQAGQRQFALVAGEAGAGKTRLVTEFARRAWDEGAIVLAGACSFDHELPFEPFVEALRHPLEALEPARRRELAGPGAADLDLLLPGLGLDDPDGPGPRGADAASRRYWMFDAVADLLRQLGRSAPVLVVLDDLHWARPSTALLLEHLVARPQDTRALLVGTCRRSPTDASAAFTELLARLPRPAAPRLVPLDGLDEGAVRELVERRAGHELDDGLRRLCRHLAEATGGNPFLIGEQWQQLVRDGELRRRGHRWACDGHGSPGRAARSVQDLVSRRLAGLGARARQLLPLAAVAGATFEASVVARAAGADLADALAALDEAAQAELVVELDPGRHRFRHGLVHQALLDGLEPAARRRAHRDVAAALEALHPDRYDRLAHHSAEAVPLLAPAAAVAWARRAAQRFRETKAYDDAASTVVEALAVADDRDDRVDLLIDLVEVTCRSGDAAAAVAAARDLGPLVQDLDDSDRLVRAALAWYEATWRTAGASVLPDGLVAEALERATGEAQRARLYGALSTALAYAGRDAEAVSVADQALALARRRGDPALLAHVLESVLFAGWADPQLVGRQRSLVEEGAAVIPLADEEVAFCLTIKAGWSAAVRGDGPQLRAAIAGQEERSRRIRQPQMALGGLGAVVAASLAFGDLERAEQAVEEFDAWSQRISAEIGGYGLMVFVLRREQDRLEELRPMVELIARLGQERQAWQPGLAALYAELDRLDDARRVLDVLAPEGLCNLSRGITRVATLSLLADACWATGHPLAAEVYDELAPWAGLAVSVPSLACLGCADRYLGKAAEAAGRSAVAERHYEAALRFDRQAGWATWQAHSELALGRFLLRRGGAAADRGRELLASAQRTAQACGAVAAARRAEQALGAAGPTTPVPVTLSERELEVLRLIAAGRTNRQVGAALHTSPHTVANQVHSILVKTGCANRAEAIAWASRAGLLG